jgi:hypothetical protein
MLRVIRGTLARGEARDRFRTPAGALARIEKVMGVPESWRSHPERALPLIEYLVRKATSAEQRASGTAAGTRRKPNFRRLGCIR